MKGGDGDLSSGLLGLPTFSTTCACPALAGPNACAPYTCESSKCPGPPTNRLGGEVATIPTGSDMEAAWPGRGASVATTAACTGGGDCGSKAANGRLLGVGDHEAGAGAGLGPAGAGAGPCAPGRANVWVGDHAAGNANVWVGDREIPWAGFPAKAAPLGDRGWAAAGDPRAAG